MKKEIYVKEIIVHQSWSRAKVGNVVNEGFNVQKYNFQIHRKRHSTAGAY